MIALGLAPVQVTVADESDSAAKLEAAWTQAELNEGYMQRLTKHQCMAKTIALLKVCDSESCIKTMAGVVGDCVTYAKGDQAQFCGTYNETYVAPNCEAGALSEISCRFLRVGKNIFCD